MAYTTKEFSYVKALSDLFSFITIGLSFVCKIPQIKHLYREKKANSISIVGLLMELFSYSIMLAYHYRNGYSVLSYMQYPVILIQEVILIYLVVYYKRMLSMRRMLLSIFYYFWMAGMIFGIIPREFITFLTPFCTPIGASSKVIQLYQMIRLKNADSISLLTWFLSFFSNFTRLFTVYVDSADAILLLDSSVNVTLSLSVMLTAYFFKRSKAKKR